MSEDLLKLTDQEFDDYLEKLGLLAPLERGELSAIEQYFQLFGGKLTKIEDKQPSGS